jgi:hypothetical protein
MPTVSASFVFRCFVSGSFFSGSSGAGTGCEHLSVTQHLEIGRGGEQAVAAHCQTHGTETHKMLATSTTDTGFARATTSCAIASRHPTQPIACVQRD